MGEAKLSQPIQVVIDVSNITIQDGNLITDAKTSESSILTRLHAGYFRVSLSLASQALLWKILSHLERDLDILWEVFYKIPSTACLLLWCLAILAQIPLFVLYILRCYFHFDLVREEFSNHIGVNYMFAPWMTWLLLLQSAPLIFSDSVLYLVSFWIFVVPLAFLNVKIYGQWFTTEKLFLSVNANPTSHVSVIANLIAARAAAQMGWMEIAVCMWSLGMVHYLVLFVTLYQRLSGSDKFPETLRPAFFLFFAAPSMASLTWTSITGTFGYVSKMLFFLSLFLFMSLVCRPCMFKKCMRKFNVAWLEYSFPLSFLALAAVEYAKEMKGRAATGLMLVLSILSVLVFIGLMLMTAANTDELLLEDDPVMSFSDSPEPSKQIRI